MITVKKQTSVEPRLTGHHRHEEKGPLNGDFHLIGVIITKII